MLRQIIAIPMANETSKENLQKSLMAKDADGNTSWGLKSTGKSFKLHKTHDKIKSGDVVLFAIKKQCSFIGLITGTRIDTTVSTTIGWDQGDDVYDLIIDFKVLKLTVDNILNYVDWNSTPSGTAIVKANSDKFWNKYSGLIDNYGIDGEHEEADTDLKDEVFTYILVQEGLDDISKIGSSKNPESRVKSFNQVPRQPKVIVREKIRAHMGLGEVLEKRIHKRLKELRIDEPGLSSTEWFGIDADAALVIALDENEKLKKLY